MTISELLLSKLIEINNAIGEDNLEHVVISSNIDQSFGRGYLRLEINVVVKKIDHNANYGFPTQDYVSYEIWGKNDGFFKRTQDEVLIELRGIMAQYYADATRAFETIGMRYPTIPIHSEICSFEIFGSTLKLKKYYQIQCIRIVDGLYVKGYYNSTLDNKWYQEQFEDCERYKNVIKENSNMFNFERKYNFSSEYWR